MDWSRKHGSFDGAQGLARAALQLAEAAHAEGKSADAVKWVDMAHSLFGAALEQAGCRAGAFC